VDAVIRGQIIGEVWATRKAPGLTGRKLVLVAAQGAGRSTGRVVVAIDTLDARAGDEVLVSFGSGARNVLWTAGEPGSGPDHRGVLADAAVSLIIDGAEPCSWDE
jgi:microcompartment protein CcmK/EutM